MDDGQDSSFVLLLLYVTLIGGGLFLLRKYIKGGQYPGKMSAKDKVAVVTGANSGIGLETVRAINLAKGKVYMLCRSEDKATDAKIELVKMGCDSTRLEFVQCDLSNFDSIKKCAKTILDKEQKIDILINNAGIMFYPKYEKTVDGHEMTWQSNHLGPFLLTELLLPAIKKSEHGKIVNVSSKLHANSSAIDLSTVDEKKSYGLLAPYNRSKLANVMHARQLSKRLHKEGTHNVSVNALHPGVVNTELGRHLIFNKSPIKEIVHPFYWFLTKTSRDGAQTSLFLALSPKAEGISGKYFADCKLKEESSLARDEQACEDLYNYSLEQVGLA